MCPQITCLFFGHDYRIFKLRIICRGTRSVLICKSLVYFRAPHFVCSGNGTRQIVILKRKIKPVSINAAVNCEEQLNTLYDLMMQCLFAMQCQCQYRLFAQCS